MADLSYFFHTPLTRSQRTVNDLITRSMQKIGVIDASRAITANEAHDGLEELNGILEQWSMESLNVFRVGEIRFPTISGQTEYRVGPGEYIDAERPNWVHGATINGDIHQPIEVNQFSPPSPVRGYVISYDPAFPAGFLTLGWTPSGEVVALRVDQELQRYETVQEPHGLPPGYARPLELALAIALAPSFDASVSQTLIKEAAAAKATLRKNASKLRIRPLGSGVGHINDPGMYGYNAIRGY